MASARPPAAPAASTSPTVLPSRPVLIAPAPTASPADPPPVPQPAVPFARPRPQRLAPSPIPGPVTTPVPAPMAATYWSRLSAMLREASTLSASLIPLSERSADKAAKGASGVVAIDLQGLRAASFFEVAGRESARDDAWKKAYQDGGVGAFASYGVANNAAHWVALRLAETCASDGWPVPAPGAELELSDATTSADAVVEAVRIRVWESEPAFLPVALSERLVGFRRRLRRYRGRVELCVKILGSLEGCGRRITSFALEKAKLALEKADAIHAKEELRIKEREDKERRAAENARLKQERKIEKAMKEKEQKVKKFIDRKKRKQASAQAMFMKRFVKQKVTPAAQAKKIECITIDGDVGENVDVPALLQGSDTDVRASCRVLPVNSDKDAMSTSWWLQSEMDARDFAELDSRLKGLHAGTNGVQASPDGAFKQHMYACAERRKAAEMRIHRVLCDYRRQRTTHLDDRMPRFTQKRADVRGRGVTGPVKLLQFAENYRPAFFGTDSRRSKAVGPRRPMSKVTELDYSYDSGEEWEEEEDAEDLLEIEADKERADEDDELRKLYGSDDEDDDDFLDDNDVDDDDDDDDDSDELDNEGEDSVKPENGITAVSEDEAPSSPKATNQAPNAVLDLTVTTSGTGTKRMRSPKRERSGEGRTIKRRRRNKFKHSVVIQGVSLPQPGEESPLDCYAVSVFDGAPRILMFNPYITHVADFLQETSPPKPAPIRIPYTSLDEGAKLDLAVVLETASSRTSRDNIVFEFCERRRSKGLPVPPKVEVVRAIRVIATNEKRKGDTRAGWYLKDGLLAAKIREMNVTTLKTREAIPAPPIQGMPAVPVQMMPDVVEACSPTTAE